jgi:tRNA (guanine-N7-)-methyltransferase
MATKGQAWAEAQRAARVAALRGRLAEALGEEGPLTLEIGCGHGHWLVAYAEAHPGERCAGIDLLGERLRKCEAKRARRGLGNVAFLKAEASEFLDALPGGPRLGKVFILYPDPWPKRRQTRKRFLQAANLDRLARAAQPGCRLAFRTDHADYHAAAAAALAAHPDWEPLAGEPWPFESPTFFQDLLRDKRDLQARRR